MDNDYYFIAFVKIGAVLLGALAVTQIVDALMMRFVEKKEKDKNDNNKKGK